MAGNSLQDAVATALNSHDQSDVIDGIKSAVITEIERLDPEVNIVTTDYFNHSYAPDFVLSWGKKQDREIYLRYNLRSAQAARDVDLLGATNPVFFSLDSHHDDAVVAEDLENGLEPSSDALVTNAPAIDGFTSGQQSADTGSVSEPLLRLFRRNVVRGGRGLLISGTAQRLQSTPGADDFEGDIAYLNAFAQTVPQIFRPDAATRLQRAVGIVRAARTGETAVFDQPIVWDEDRDVIGGKLETDELKILLPYLLARANTIDSDAFWQYVGDMFSLKQLEELAEVIGSASLNRLVVANLDVWRAARASVSFSPHVVEDERVAPYWSVHARMLAATAGAWRVHFTTDKRRGGSQADMSLPRWEDLWPQVSAFTLSSVDLQGMTRRVRVSAEDRSNVVTDVDSIRTTIEDDFRVRSLSVRPVDPEASGLTVDFKTMTAEGTNVYIGDLASAAFDILGHRNPLAEQERRLAFGRRVTRGVDVGVDRTAGLPVVRQAQLDEAPRGIEGSSNDEQP